jgi:phosphoribosylglycinamide formyltransferase-1
MSVAAAGKKKRIVVLISGSGSNLQAIIDARIDAEIACVISNRPDAFGLERARNAAITAITIDHRQFGSREAFDAELMRTIDAQHPDLVVLAGFMRILTADFVTHYRGRLVNIHPSLLPKYTGLHTHRRALEAGDAEHGATVHFVTEQLDGGPAIMQARMPIKPDDTEQSLAARLLLQEHAIYPLAVQWFIEGRLQLDDNRVLLDGNELPDQGFQYQLPRT